jgi:hypothetical protein
MFLAELHFEALHSGLLASIRREESCLSLHKSRYLFDAAVRSQDMIIVNFDGSPAPYSVVVDLGVEATSMTFSRTPKPRSVRKHYTRLTHSKYYVQT